MKTIPAVLALSLSFGTTQMPSLAELQKMTAQYLKPHSMTIVVVGDKAKISDQLPPFETGKL